MINFLATFCAFLAPCSHGGKLEDVEKQVLSLYQQYKTSINSAVQRNVPTNRTLDGKLCVDREVGRDSTHLDLRICGNHIEGLNDLSLDLQKFDLKPGNTSLEVYAAFQSQMPLIGIGVNATFHSRNESLSGDAVLGIANSKLFPKVKLSIGLEGNNSLVIKSLAASLGLTGYNVSSVEIGEVHGNIIQVQILKRLLAELPKVVSNAEFCVNKYLFDDVKSQGTELASEAFPLLLKVVEDLDPRLLAAVGNSSTPFVKKWVPFLEEHLKKEIGNSIKLKQELIGTLFTIGFNVIIKNISGFDTVELSLNAVTFIPSPQGVSMVLHVSSSISELDIDIDTKVQKLAVSYFGSGTVKAKNITIATKLRLSLSKGLSGELVIEEVVSDASLEGALTLTYPNVYWRDACQVTSYCLNWFLSVAFKSAEYLLGFLVHNPKVEEELSSVLKTATISSLPKFFKEIKHYLNPTDKRVVIPAIDEPSTSTPSPAPLHLSTTMKPSSLTTSPVSLPSHSNGGTPRLIGLYLILLAYILS